MHSKSVYSLTVLLSSNSTPKKKGVITTYSLDTYNVQH